MVSKQHRMSLKELKLFFLTLELIPRAESGREALASESDDDDDDEEESVEVRRQRNVEDNRKFLEGLEIPQAKIALADKSKSAKKKEEKDNRKTVPDPAAVRLSCRAQAKDEIRSASVADRYSFQIFLLRPGLEAGPISRPLGKNSKIASVPRKALP